MGKIWRRVVFVLLMLLLCSGSSLSLFTNVGFLFEKKTAIINKSDGCLYCRRSYLQRYY